jgi:hypothetical protein
MVLRYGTRPLAGVKLVTGGIRAALTQMRWIEYPFNFTALQ